MPIPLQTTGLLVTAQEVTDWTGADAAKAALIAEMVSGQIRAYLGQSILLDQYTETLRVGADLVFRPNDADEVSGTVGVIRPRQRPVVQILAVVADGTTLATDEWAWDETRGEVLLDDPTFYAATVTYQAGYPTTPDDVRAVALSLASGMVSNPAGVQSERLADYSVTYGGAGMSDYHRAVLNRYKPTASTIRPS